MKPVCCFFKMIWQNVCNSYGHGFPDDKVSCFGFDKNRNLYVCRGYYIMSKEPLIAIQNVSVTGAQFLVLCQTLARRFLSAKESRAHIVLPHSEQFILRKAADRFHGNSSHQKYFAATGSRYVLQGESTAAYRRKSCHVWNT